MIGTSLSRAVFAPSRRHDAASSACRLASAVLAGLLFMAGLAAPAGAAEWPVAEPSDIRAAMRRAGPGDVLVMADGVWRNKSIVFSGEGAIDNPITLRAQTPGKVILSGESTLWAMGRHLVIEGIQFRDGGLGRSKLNRLKQTPGGPQSVVTIGPGSDIRLTDCAIDAYNSPLEHRWVRLEGTDHEVDHCTFAGKTNRKPVLNLYRPKSERHGHFIHNNYFAGRPPGDGNGFECLQLGTGLNADAIAGILVEHNLFARCDGEIEIISNKSGGNVFRGNVFRANRGTLTLRNGHGNIVEGNVFYGDGVEASGGIRITGRDNRIVGNYLEGLWGTKLRSAITVMTGTKDSPGKRGGYNQVDGTLIADNILVNNSQGLSVGMLGEKYRRGDVYPAINTSIENNLIAGAEGTPLALADDLSGITWRDNIIAGSPPPAAAGIDGIHFADPDPTAVAAGRDAIRGRLSDIEVGASWSRVPLLP